MEVVVRVINDEGDTEIEPLTVSLANPDATIGDFQQLVAADTRATCSAAVSRASSPYELYVFTSVEEALRDNLLTGLPRDARVEHVLTGAVDERTPSSRAFEWPTFFQKLEPGYPKDCVAGPVRLHELVIFPRLNRCEGSPHPWDEAPVPPSDLPVEMDTDDGKLWRLPAGLFGFPFTGDTFFFQREATRRIMREFFQGQVVDNGKIGWLEGKEGYGATLLALVFGLVHLRHDWTITLIQHYAYGVLRYDRGGTRRQQKILQSRALARVDVNLILNDVPSTQKHFVIVKRLLGTDYKGKLLGVITDWLQTDTGTKRLVFIEDGPLTSPVRQRFEAGCPRGEICEELLPAWTLEEFQEAFRNDEFYAFCKDRLTGCEAQPSHELSRETRVRAKHYFTGGNMLKHARMMDMMQILEAHWWHLTPPTFCGFSIYRDFKPEFSEASFDTYDIGDGKLANVLTPYAIAAIAMEAGAEQLKAFHTTEDKVVNRWIDDHARRNGSLLEAQFYAELHNGSVTVYVGVERIETVWLGRIDWLRIDQDYRNEALHPLLAQRHISQWWKRPRLNIGGYDTVYVDINCGLVRFVQLVKPYTAHGVIHWAYMASFLQDLMEASAKKHRKKTRKRRKAEAAFVIQRVEMFVVMPEDSLSTFRISEMTDVERMVEMT